MTVTSVSIGLGIFMGFVALTSLILNVLVIYLIVGGGFLRARENSIYILSFTNLLIDGAHATFVFIYLTPSSIVQDWLIATNYWDPGARVIAYCFQVCWYASELTQILMTLNRVVAVLFPAHISLFSRKKVIIYCYLVFVGAAFLSVLADEILPCCTTYFYYGTYSYKFFGPANTTNYKNYFMDIPLNSATSGFSLLAYGAIFLTVYKSNRNMLKLDKTMSRRKQNEIRYAVQFAAISLFFLAAWISFRILPLVTPASMPELYIITLLFVLMHCTANALIYLGMNKEIKKVFQQKFTRTNNTSKMKITSVSNVPPSKSQIVIAVSS